MKRLSLALMLLFSTTLCVVSTAQKHRNHLEKTEQTIIRKTKRNPIFKRSDKTRKTKCTLEKCPFFLRLRKK